MTQSNVRTPHPHSFHHAGFTLLEAPIVPAPTEGSRTRHARQGGFTLLEAPIVPAPTGGTRTRHARQGGFTLLEMLVAIAIFASLSMGAYQVLQGVLTSDEVAKRKEARLGELQLAFTLLERDVTQMVPRSGRIEGENNKVLLAASRFGQQSDDWGMAFMRSGWLNPDGMLPRSHLQRVGWRLKDKQLERLSYLYPDPVIGTEPRIQPVLAGVTAFRLYFYDKGRWREEWPQRSVLPYGLAVELDLEDYGTLRRQFLIGAGGQRAEENSQSSNPDQNGGNQPSSDGNGDASNGDQDQDGDNQSSSDGADDASYDNQDQDGDNQSFSDGTDDTSYDNQDQDGDNQSFSDDTGDASDGN